MVFVSEWISMHFATYNKYILTIISICECKKIKILDTVSVTKGKKLRKQQYFLKFKYVWYVIVLELLGIFHLCTCIQHLASKPSAN